MCLFCTQSIRAGSDWITEELDFSFPICRHNIFFRKFSILLFPLFPKSFLSAIHIHLGPVVAFITSHLLGGAIV